MIEKITFNSVINKAVTYDLTLEQIRELTIPERHLLVSLIPTPPEFVEQKQGIDYVKAPYMREIAQIWYGGYDFEIKDSRIISDPDGNSWSMINGELRWTESGEGVFVGGMVDAHRIQFTKGTKAWMDAGNDIKASVTDCLKKALNMHLNISDDVYRWEGCYLPDQEKQRLWDFASKTIESKPAIKEAIDKALVRLNRGNYMEIYKRIKELE